ncbi:MAG: FHA domain-containing protein [Labilithrix sp.]|nr:FHA domain-containing protein [Labilithrix sp.]MCW5809711.1 FHA domain-containing protein [Labilithrix sp.]
MSLHLQLLLGRERGRVIPLAGGTYVFGRGEDGDIVLQSDLVSRTHARITASASDLLITDLESSNGTFLNGSRIVGETKVAIGDVISIGDVVARVYGNSPAGLLPGAAPGMIAGSLTEVPPASVIRAIGVLKRTGFLNLTSPPLNGRIAFMRGHVGEVVVDTRKTRDPIQAITSILRWRGTFDFEPSTDVNDGTPLLGLDAIIPPTGSAARPSMLPKPPRPSRP